MKFTATIALLAFVLISSGAAHAAPFQQGITLAAWEQKTYQKPATVSSLRNLAATGASWAGIVVTAYQQKYTSTNIRIDGVGTPTDEDLKFIIGQAHKLGLKVMMKPLLDLSNDDAHWRGDIGTKFTRAQWAIWFKSYRGFIKHYAALAKSTRTELFCVGTEMEGTTHQASNWRAVVADVRKLYNGQVVYAANWGGEETSITWWDAVDFIGVDAYYELTDKNNPSVEEMKAAWIDRGYVSLLENLGSRWGKKVILTELGFRSISGANKEPFDWARSGKIDLQEQANAYRATFEVFMDKPWLAGMFWWAWDPDPNVGGGNDKSYTPHGKPAEDVLREFFGGALATRVSTDE